MSIDEQHVALPKLYGAPAYARRPAVAGTVSRPFDPDDMPIEASMTEEEREYASSLPARAWAPGGGVVPSGNGHGSRATGEPTIKGRAFNLKAIAGRLLGSD